MKKILILSYHSLPLDVIASYRANAYLKHLKKFGFEPTLLTHFLGMDSDHHALREEYNYGTIIRIPFEKSLVSRFFEFLEKIPYLNKASILLRWASGYLDSDPKAIRSYEAMKNYCFKQVDFKEYHLVVGIFSPHHHLRICYKIHRRYKIPYVLDFRDLWNNRVIHNYYIPNQIEKIQDALTKRYWKKWLSKASFFTITSEAWKNKIQEFTSTKGYIITNGYDAEAFENFDMVGSNSEFVLLYAGTLYEHQRLDIFLQGCHSFIENHQPDKFKVKFIGSDRPVMVRCKVSGFMYQPKKRILDKLNSNYCEVIRRIPKVELFKEMEHSQLLLFPGFPDAPGTHTGKIFDYLGARRNILMVGDDHDVVGNMIRETNAGVIKNTPNGVSEYLISIYNQWMEIKTTAYSGNVAAIYQYSRENQVRKMGRLLTNELTNKELC
ncbi:MAG: hypothetical protein AAGI25_07705 [Bacteroidota bacterium]